MGKPRGSWKQKVVLRNEKGKPYRWNCEKVDVSLRKLYSKDIDNF